MFSADSAGRLSGWSMYDAAHRVGTKPPRKVHRIVMPVASLAPPNQASISFAHHPAAGGTGFRVGAVSSSAGAGVGVSTAVGSHTGDSMCVVATVPPIFVENTRISVRDRNPLLQKRATQRTALSPTPMRHTRSPTKGMLPQISNCQVRYGNSSPSNLRGSVANSRSIGMDQHLRDLQQLCVDLGWDD